MKYQMKSKTLRKCFGWPSSLELVAAPAAILNQWCSNVREEIPERIIDRMHEIMKENSGAGLAAPQVGIGLRFFIIDAFNGIPQNPLVIINPFIISSSTDNSIYNEGCLSVPGIQLPVSRPSQISVAYQSSFDSDVIELYLSDIDARVFLHEYDHLNGILFTKRFSHMFDYHKNKES